MTEKVCLRRKKITAADVAKAAGCSVSSVSKVMNSHPNLSEHLRRNVLEQAGKLHYDLRRGKLRQLAVILPAPWRSRLDGYVAALLNALVYVLYQRGIRMEIVQENDLAMLQSRVIDGGISISWEPELTKNWFEIFQLPLVRINANPDLSGRDSLLSYVCMDGESSMKSLLDKFYSLGHRRIILLTPDSMEIEQRRTRYQGFFNYLKAHHVQHPEKNCIFNMRENSFEQNLAMLKQAVSSGATALIAVDEGAARDALSLIEKLSLNVPKRISVVSWEQKNVLPYFDPPITGMVVDYTQLSEAAVDQLSALCRGEKVSNIYFPFRMIDRRSIAPVYRKRRKGNLAERISMILAKGPETRKEIAAELEMKPYSGYFSRTILELLNEKRIVYKKNETPGRKRLLALANSSGND